MQWKTIDSILKKLCIKIWFNRMLKSMENILLIGSVLTSIIIIISHFKSIVYLNKKIFYIWHGLLIVILVKTLFNKPSLKDTAKGGDSLGFQEKLLTYVEFNQKDEQGEVFQIFKTDLENELQDYDLVKKYKFHIKGKKILVSFLIMIMCFGIYFIPSFSREEAISMENINKDIKKEILNLNKSKKNMLNKIEDNEEKKEVSEILKKLEQNLKSTYRYEKALQEISKAEEKINGIKDLKDKKNLKLLSYALKGTELEGSKLDLDLLKGAIDQEDLQNENLQLSKKDVDKIKDNLRNNKDIVRNKDIKNKIEDKLKEDKVTTKELVKSVKNKKEEIKLTSEFKKSKEKLTAKKSRKDFEGGKGDKKSNNFSLGKKESSYKYGEKSESKDSQENIKGQGDTRKEDNNAVGSGKTSVNKEIKEKANKGTIKKDNNLMDLEERGYSSNTNSKVSKDGKLFNKKIEEVKGIQGENQYMKNKWLQYKKSGMDYILKYEVPVDKEDMVIDYFNELNSGRN